MTRFADTTATVTTLSGARKGEQQQVHTFALGAWEQGALQVLLDVVSGQFASEFGLAFADAVALEQTTLGSTAADVEKSLAHLGSLVRGFSQADSAEITATFRL
jgi:hypothetical protein